MSRLLAFFSLRIAFLAAFLAVFLAAQPAHANARVRWLTAPVGNAFAPHLHVIPGRGVIVAASAQDSFGPSRDMFVAFVDRGGRVQWTKFAVARHVRDLVGHGDRVFVSTEFMGDVRFDDIRLHAPGHTAGFIARLDQHGSADWGRLLETPDFTRMDAIAAADDGGAYVAAGVFWGASKGPLAVPVAGGKDTVIVKLDERGDVAWRRTFSWRGYDEASSLVPVGSDVVLAGTRWNAKSTWESNRVDGWSHGWVTRLDQDGKPVWETSLGQRFGRVTIRQAIARADGSIVVLGRYRGIARIAESQIGADGAWGGYLAELDSNGRVVRVRAQGEHELMTGNLLWSQAACLTATKDGRVIAVGSRGVALLTGDGHSWLIRFRESDYVTILDCGMDGGSLYFSGSAERGSVLGGQRLEVSVQRGWYRSWSQGFVGRVDLE